MARKANTRGAQGDGTIRQRKDGIWEARFTIGKHPGTGKQIQKSLYGKSQSEVRKKLKQATAAIDEGTYKELPKITVSQWMEKWLSDYTANLKPYSLRNYQAMTKNHICPLIGAIKICDLTSDKIQHMYNTLRTDKELSPKTLRNIHAILHSALDVLVDEGILKINPSSVCGKRLPKVVKHEMKCIADADLAKFMDTITGDSFENLFLVDLFTGMRQGELLGLRWSCIDFEKGCISIDKQLYMPEKGGKYTLQSLKNRKARIIYPAPFVFDALRRERIKQNKARFAAGNMWDEGDLPGLVFTNEFGRYISHKTAYKRFKSFAEQSGIPSVRFHDMRHSFAVAALRSGDDVKTVQESLGHATAAFTLDIYAHVTDQMRKESAARMESYISSIKAAK